MDSIGERLREERERLGYSQTAFGALAEITKQSQIKYEKGERSPDADYLFAIMRAGADVQYIVGGIRSSVALTPDEQALIARYRAASFEVKTAALGALSASTAPPASTKFSIDFGHATIGQNNTVSGGSHTFKATTSSKKK